MERACLMFAAACLAFALVVALLRWVGLLPT